jgi:L-asparaginase
MNRAVLPCILLGICSGLVAEPLPRVAVLSTGGTIASRRNPAKGGYEPAFSGENLIEAVPAVRKLAQIQVEQICNISSSDMTPAIWVQLVYRL